LVIYLRFNRNIRETLLKKLAIQLTLLSSVIQDSLSNSAIM